jgi:hypothetical protein
MRAGAASAAFSLRPEGNGKDTLVVLIGSDPSCRKRDRRSMNKVRIDEP